MANWILTTTMAVTMQMTGPGTQVGSSASSSASSRDGFPTEADCRKEGEAMREAMLRRHPGAQVTFDCRRAG